MQGARLQLVPEVANNGERAPEVQGLAATLAAGSVQYDGDTSSTAKGLHLADELIPDRAELSDENVRL